MYFLGDSKLNYYILVGLREQEMDLIWAPLLEILSVCWGIFGEHEKYRICSSTSICRWSQLNYLSYTKIEKPLSKKRNLARWYHLIPVILPRNSGYFSDVSCKICSEQKLKGGDFYNGKWSVKQPSYTFGLQAKS